MNEAAGQHAEPANDHDGPRDPNLLRTVDHVLVDYNTGRVVLVTPDGEEHPLPVGLGEISVDQVRNEDDLTVLAALAYHYQVTFTVTVPTLHVLATT